MTIGLWLSAFVVGLQTISAPIELPAGTVLHARLTSAVSSQTSRPHDEVSAVLIAPVPIGTRVVPAGSLLRGAVGAVTAHSVDHQARLRLDFDRLEVAGSATAIASRVLAVDNAREKVNKTGLILGPDTQVDRSWGRVELLALAVFVPEIFIVDAAGSRIREGVRVDISYKPGVELDLETTAASDLRGADLPAMAAAWEIPESLQALILTLPVRASAGKPPRAADLINVVFIGSPQSLSDAFARAGWTTADSISMRADVRTFLAIAGHESYLRGPVSLQTLEGRPPDYVFQKQNNTFGMRHHVRIWRRGSWQGRPLWVGAATHDVGVKFAAPERSFTHRVDGRIDIEREKIVDDLMFADVPPAGYVDRPAVPRSTKNATQDAISTDGRVAVVRLNDLN